MTVLLLLTFTEDIEIDSVRRYFKGHGYEVETARTGRECATKLFEIAPDVLTPEPGPPQANRVPTSLGEGDGPAVPFVFIVGKTAGNLSGLLSTPNARYLPTPVALKTLLETIRSLQTHRAT
jgi:hypothetical protein